MRAAHEPPRTTYAEREGHGLGRACRRKSGFPRNTIDLGIRSRSAMRGKGRGPGAGVGPYERVDSMRGREPSRWQGEKA
jgi:hypothetical protein